MKTVDVTKAKGTLAHYARKAHEQPILVTENGQPLATLTFVGESDAEQIALSKNPRFLSILQRSLAHYKAHGGYSQEEVERMFAVKPTRASRNPGSSARCRKRRINNRTQART